MNFLKIFFYILVCTVSMSAQWGFAQTSSTFPGGDPGAQSTSSCGEQSLLLQPSTLTLASPIQAALDNVKFSACGLSQTQVGSPTSGGLAGDASNLSLAVPSGSVIGTAATSIGGSLDALFGDCDKAKKGKPDLSACLYTANDKVNAEKYDEMIKSMEENGKIASCNYNRAQAAKTAADCFSEQLRALKQDMLSIKSDLDTNLKQMGQYITCTKANIQQEQRKQETLNGKIQTLKDTLAEVQGTIDTLDGSSSGNESRDIASLSGLKRRYQDFKAEQKAFTIAQRNEQIRRAVVCFEGQGSTQSLVSDCYDHTASGNKRSLDPIQCIATMYRNARANQISNGGQLTPDVLNKANDDTVSLKRRMGTILRELIGTEPRYSTIEAFKAAHQREFSRWGGAGEALLTELQACYDNEGKESVANELTDPATPLGERAHKVQDTAEAVNSDLGHTLRKLDTVYRNAYKEFTGSEVNEAFAGMDCHSAPVTSNTGRTVFQTAALGIQVDCVENLKHYLDAMVNGRNPNNANVPVVMPLNVPGLDGSPAYCQGLRDCLDGRNGAKKLLAASIQQQKGMEGDGFFKDACVANPQIPCTCPADPKTGISQCPGIKQYTRNRNTEVEGAVKYLASQLKERMNNAQKQLELAKRLYSKAGIEFPSEQSGVSRDFKCSQDPNSDQPTLCQLPDPFEDKMLASAGFSALEPSAFGTATREANAKMSEYKKEVSESHSDLSRVEDKKNFCMKEAKEKEEQKSEKKFAGFESKLDKLLAQCKEAGAGGRYGSGMQTPIVDVGSFASGFKQLAKDISDACSISDSVGKCGMLKAEVGGDDSDTKCETLAKAETKKLYDQKVRDREAAAEALSIFRDPATKTKGAPAATEKDH